MRHQKRKPLIKATLEKRLAKNERRIQAIAEESYKVRQMIAQLDAEEAPKAAKVTEGDKNV